MVHDPSTTAMSGHSRTAGRPGRKLDHRTPSASGGREEDVPRHGSAVPGADVDGIHDASRGSRMAGWTIRRKLSLLAILPMIVLLIGGGVFATSVALDYRAAHTTRNYADTLVPALRAAQALGNEFSSPGTLTDKAKLAAARKASDDNLRQLTPELRDMADAEPPV